MARCEGCGLFASLEMDDSSDVQIEVSADEYQIGVSVSAELTLNSACCGMEMKSASVEAEETVDRPCECGVADDEPSEYHCTSEASEPEDRYQTVDRRGKPIRNPRYQKHFWGMRVTGTVTCETNAKHSADFDVLVEEQGSGFEEY